MNAVQIRQTRRAVRNLLWSISVLGLLLTAGSGPAQAATHFIKMVNFAFQPSTLTITAGDTVTWTNTTTTGHNVVSSTGAWSPSALFTSPGTFSVTFHTPGNYAYFCSPHQSFGMTGTITVQAAAQPPTVALTEPTSGITLAAPANVQLSATATASAGQHIASVTFLSGATQLGVVSSSPYSLVASNLAANTYHFTAKALDNLGASATSAVVTVNVVTPAPISFGTNFALAGAEFPLSIHVTPGLSYEVQYTSSLTNWLTFTNFLATNSVMVFSSPTTGSERRFFRARLLPNP